MNKRLIVLAWNYLTLIVNKLLRLLSSLCTLIEHVSFCHNVSNNCQDQPHMLYIQSKFSSIIISSSNKSTGTEWQKPHM